MSRIAGVGVHKGDADLEAHVTHDYDALVVIDPEVLNPILMPAPTD